MSMPDNVKAKLRQIAQDKRSKQRKAKDYIVTDWLVACDYAKDQGHCGEGEEAKIKACYPCLILSSDPRLNKVCTDNAGTIVYLRYVPKDCVVAVVNALPHMVGLQAIPRTGTQREVYVFWRETIACIMTFLELDMIKYTNNCYELVPSVAFVKE